MNKETRLQNEIRASVNDIAVTFRANVGLFFTKDGRPVSTGLPSGFCDLFGFRKSDGEIFFIEVKTKNGKPTKQQKNFISAMQAHGVRAGIARSVEDARRIIESDPAN